MQPLLTAYGEATVRCISVGARTSGQLWQAAYRLNPADHYSGVVARKSLEVLFENATFLPPLHLANLKPDDFRPRKDVPPRWPTRGRHRSPAPPRF